MSHPWEVGGMCFPTDTAIVPHSDPIVTVTMPIDSMVEFQERTKTLRITVTATVRWYGQREGASSLLLNDTSNIVTWQWEETFSTPPENKLPSTPIPVGTWNALLQVVTSGSHTTEVTPFYVYDGSPGLTDNPEVVSYTLAPSIRIGVSSTTGQATIYDAGTGYSIEVWGSVSISVNTAGTDDDQQYDTVTVTPVIGLTDLTGSMGTVEVAGFSAGDCIQDYADPLYHAGISVHALNIVVEVIEQHPVPAPLG